MNDDIENELDVEMEEKVYSDEMVIDDLIRRNSYFKRSKLKELMSHELYDIYNTPDKQNILYFLFTNPFFKINMENHEFLRDAVLETEDADICSFLVDTALENNILELETESFKTFVSSVVICKNRKLADLFVGIFTNNNMQERNDYEYITEAIPRFLSRKRAMKFFNSITYKEDVTTAELLPICNALIFIKNKEAFNKLLYILNSDAEIPKEIRDLVEKINDENCMEILEEIDKVYMNRRAKKRTLAPITQLFTKKSDEVE